MISGFSIMAFLSSCKILTTEASKYCLALIKYKGGSVRYFIYFTTTFKPVAIQQVSGSNHVQLNGLLKCSGQSDNTATQGIYNKSNLQYM